MVGLRLSYPIGQNLCVSAKSSEKRQNIKTTHRDRRRQPLHLAEDLKDMISRVSEAIS